MNKLWTLGCAFVVMFSMIMSAGAIEKNTIRENVIPAHTKPIPDGFKLLKDNSFPNIINGFSSSAGESVIPDKLFNQLSKVSWQTEKIPSNVRMNLMKSMSPPDSQGMSQFTGIPKDMAARLGDITFTGNVTTLWKQAIAGKTIVSSTLVPDLDGDGFNDTLVVSYDVDEATRDYEYTLSAKRGIDGSILWSESVMGNDLQYGLLYGIPAGDLNSDGIEDILVSIYENDGKAMITKITMKAKNGSSGADIWNQTISGNNVYASGNPVKDMNGDGINDIYMESSGYDENTRTFSSTLAIKDGSNGDDIWNLTMSDRNIWLYGVPVDDLDGDGLQDILVSINEYEPPGNYKSTLTAKKGSNGNDLWSQYVTGSYAWLYGSQAGDLNGDGKNDVLVVEHNQDGDTAMSILSATDGYTGKSLWSQTKKANIWDSAWISGIPAGDLNGDGNKDVLVTLNEYNQDTQTSSYTVTAVKGSNGAALWNQSLKGMFVYMNAYPAGDLNGDKSEDVLINSGTYNLTTGVSALKLAAKKGSNGANLWTESISSNGSDWSGLSGYPVEDINGDGLKDVIVNIGTYNSTTDVTAFTLAAMNGSSGVDLWSESISGSNVWLNSYLAGDLDGDKVNDILVNVGSADIDAGKLTNSIKAKIGKDGTDLWKANANTWMWISQNYGGGKSSADFDGDGIDEISLGTFRNIFVVKVP